jgi:hypothetical protein
MALIASTETTHERGKATNTEIRETENPGNLGSVESRLTGFLFGRLKAHDDDANGPAREDLLTGFLICEATDCNREFIRPNWKSHP